MKGYPRGLLTSFGLAAALLLLATSCAPGAVRDRGGDGAAARPAGGVKTLQLGMTLGSEPADGLVLFSSSTGPLELMLAFHAGLTIYDADGNLRPQLAQKVPTIQDGDWQALPDGRMEVTWRLRPDVRWHDGTPLTAEDVVFGARVVKDEDLPANRGRSIALISQITALDPHTVAVSWSSPYMAANANGLEDIVALPRHLLAEAYERGDKQAFLNHAYWTREFVGLGPYRLGEWQLGSHTEGLASDDYFLGRPKIDRVVFRYFGDVNSLVAAQLAMDVDMAAMGSFKLEQMLAVKNAWEPRGEGTVIGVLSGTRNLRVQHRDPTAPWKDLRVRQALVHMMDRATLAETLSYGLVTPADTLVGPNDPVYRLLEQRGLTRYPFDLARAQRLMGEAGWVRGTDGVYRSPAGDPFSIEVRSTDKSDNVRENQAIAAQLKEAGLVSSTVLIPDAASSSVKAEMRSIFPGLLGWSLKDSLETMQHLTSPQTPTEQNRWRGANYGAYSNPTFDRLFDSYAGALDSSARQGFLADLLKIDADDVASIHLSYDMATSIMSFRKGLRGPGMVPPVQLANAWNIHTWELD